MEKNVKLGGDIPPFPQLFSLVAIYNIEYITVALHFGQIFGLLFR
jgi:hypothetical protein